MKTRVLFAALAATKRRVANVASMTIACVLA